MISIEQRLSETHGAKYYKYMEPVSSYPPANSALYAFEYKGFIVSREGTDYILWCIKTLEDTLPPLSLRGRFTTKQLATNHIDAFWDQEKKNKEAHRLALEAEAAKQTSKEIRE